MSFDGALVTEQGVTFAIVCVKPYVLRSTDKEDVREQFSSFFWIRTYYTDGAKHKRHSYV